MAKRSRAKKPSKGSSGFALPRAAFAGVFEEHPAALKAVEGMFQSTIENPRGFVPADFVQIERAFEETDWSSSSQAKILGLLPDTKHVGCESLVLWIRSHEQDDVEGVSDCMRILPPPEVRIICRMAKRGSQKRVFKASWGLYQRTVVLKEPLVSRIIEREALTHPLNIEQANIIRTYILRNSTGQDFFVEDMLDQVLSDEEPFRGVEHVGRMLHDIATALAFLHSREFIHGDVKPDNIGMHDNRFILLDFGICRKKADFHEDTTPTGSLRTRPPEAFLGQPLNEPSDVWALGASAARLCCERFPLILPSEPVPRITEPTERQKFEQEVTRRVRHEYDQHVQETLQQCVDERLRGILRDMLKRNPAERPTAGEVAERVRDCISSNYQPGSFSMDLDEEARSILALWPNAEAFRRIPENQRAVQTRQIRDLAGRLNRSAELQGKLRTLLE